jgi:type III secretory pathway component EscU
MYQLIYGIKAIRRTTKMRVWKVFITSLGLQFVCTFAGFFIALKSFTGKCATPVTGILAFGMLFGVFIFAIAVLQFIVDFIYQNKRRKLN